MSGIELSAAQLPEMLKSYISSLTTAPDGWNSIGPLMGGIKNSTSDLKSVTRASACDTADQQMGKRDRYQDFSRDGIHRHVWYKGRGEI
jgi:hypothetical protein